MPNYTAMPLAEQIPMLEQEDRNQRLRQAKSQMWKQAVYELDDADAELGGETDKLEPRWTDTAGDNFVAKARDTQRVLRQWSQNISSANPADKLDQINTLVPQALSLAQANQKLFQQYMATQGGVAINLGYSADQLEAPYREPSGRLMDQIAALYEQAGDAVTKAGSGPKYRGIDSNPESGGPSPSVRGGGGGGAPTGAVSASPGGGAPTGEVTDPLADAAQKTGADGQDALSRPDPSLTSPLGADGGGGGADLPSGADAVDGGGQDPTLSGGLGTAPTPSVTSPVGAGGGAGTGAGGLGTGGGASPIPSLNGGLGGTGGTGARPGGGTGGGGGTGLGALPTPVTSLPGRGTGSGGGPFAGARVPGVSLGGGAGIPGLGSAGGIGGGGIGGGGLGTVGGGTGQIPAAATPYQAPASPGPGGVAPTAPTTAGAATTAGGSGSGGGMGGMPMSPMGMGGTGAGGGAPGSGAASRPSGNNRNRRKEVVTPGLPVMLSGKAGMADMNAFAGRGRRQVQESDVPTTVQLIDEDLWQVEQKPVTDERLVAPPVRRVH
jgi:hypothetical protein